MLLTMGDRLKARKQSGIGLLELMLAIAIISLLLLMAVRYYRSARQQQQIADTISKVSGAVAAEANWASNNSTNAYAADSTLITNNYLPSDATTNPWGGSAITIAGGGSAVITVPGISTTAICTNLAGMLQAKVGGVSATCSGTTLTVTYQ